MSDLASQVRVIDPNTALVQQAGMPIANQTMPETGLDAVTSQQADVPPHETHADPTALGLNATAWVALSMAVVIALMIWKKVPAAIGRALDKKIAAIRSQLDEAAQIRAEAEALKAEYLAKTANADQEAAAMIERARAESQAIVAKAQADAEALVERRTRMAEDKIASAERAAMDEVRTRAAAAAATAAQRLIRERHDAAADRALVDSTIAALGTR